MIGFGPPVPAWAVAWVRRACDTRWIRDRATTARLPGLILRMLSTRQAGTWPLRLPFDGALEAIPVFHLPCR